MFGGEASHGFEGTVFELKRQRQSVLKTQCMLLFLSQIWYFHFPHQSFPTKPCKTKLTTQNFNQIFPTTSFPTWITVNSFLVE